MHQDISDHRSVSNQRFVARGLLAVIALLLLLSLATFGAVLAQVGEPNQSPTTAIPTDAESDQVMATAAQFRVDESGAATYSIPLMTVPATTGVAPELALSYSSQGGEGPAGRGWSIAGQSAISRCRATPEAGDFMVAGQVTQPNPRPVVYGAGDRFCLDGQRLLVVSDGGACAAVSGMSAQMLRTEIESFQRVCAYSPTTGNNGPAFFTVERKDGSISWYGDRDNNA